MSVEVAAYREIPAESFPKAESGSAAQTVLLHYDDAKPFLSGKPLRRATRNRPLNRATVDQIDVAVAKEAMKEPGSISLDDLQRELGL